MFSSRTNWELRPNQLTLKLQEFQKNGVEILDLTESNPTKCSFEFPDQKILAALLNPKNLSYQPSPKGLLEARQAIAAYYKEKGVSVNPEQIFLTASTSEAYSVLFRLLANPGERILVPRPSYPLFDYLATLSDVALDSYPLTYEKNWRINLKELSQSENKNYKAMLLVHPNNPTGSFVKKQEFAKLNQFCTANSSCLIADEVFLDFAYQNDSERVVSFASNSETLTFTLGGISKMLALPQMKLGWIVVSGPGHLVKNASERLEVVLDTYLSVNTPVQRALAGWFLLKNEIQTEILSRVIKNRNELKKRIDSNSGFELLDAEGGWYAVLKIAGGTDEEKWVLDLLGQKHVLIHPGFFYDFESQESHIVLSLLPEAEIFAEAVRRLEKFLPAK